LPAASTYRFSYSDTELLFPSLKFHVYIINSIYTYSTLHTLLVKKVKERDRFCIELVNEKVMVLMMMTMMMIIITVIIQMCLTAF
jgi:hypothetical protein